MSHTGKLINAAPVGLLGFGMTTVLLNLHYLGIIELSIVIIAMALALGGAAQIVAGVTEHRIGNSFLGIIFTLYGFFWWSLCVILINPFKPEAFSTDATSLGFYLLLWAIVTLFFFIASLPHNRLTQFIFLSLTALFLLLAIANFSGIPAVLTVAGIVGLLCGSSAVYAAVAQIVNAEFDKKVLPI